MRYLVTAKVKPGKAQALLRTIEDESLGKGSVAFGEYLNNMTSARLVEQGEVKWVEVCFCAEPLEEERPYWEEFFELVRVQDAHIRSRCRDLTGAEPWACGECDCSRQLEGWLGARGRSFLEVLRESTNR